MSPHPLGPLPAPVPAPPRERPCLPAAGLSALGASCRWVHRVVPGPLPPLAEHRFLDSSLLSGCQHLTSCHREVTRLRGGHRLSAPHQLHACLVFPGLLSSGVHGRSVPSALGGRGAARPRGDRLISEGRRALRTTAPRPAGSSRGLQPLRVSVWPQPSSGRAGVSSWCRPPCLGMSDAERCSMCFLASCVSSLGQCSFRSFPTLKMGCLLITESGDVITKL